MITIAVLITCFNRVDQTIACLESLYNVIKPDNVIFDVYLVDDGSTDNTRGIVSGLFPSVNIISGNGNLYWNRGMHLAWSIASDSEYDFYMWLNNDVILFNDSLATLINCANLKNNRAIICSTMKSKFTGLTTYGGRNINGQINEPNGSLLECSFINGNCVLIPKLVYAIVGNLDPIFHHAMGDYDYGLRTIKSGFSLVSTPQYIGYCEKNERIYDWKMGNKSLFERLSSMYSPLGYVQPFQYYIYVRRHFGLFKALSIIIYLHLRVLFPTYFNK